MAHEPSPARLRAAAGLPTDAGRPRLVPAPAGQPRRPRPRGGRASTFAISLAAVVAVEIVALRAGLVAASATALAGAASVTFARHRSRGPSFAAPRALLMREMARSRRHDRPLAIVRIRTVGSRRDARRLCGLVTAATRSLDFVWAERGAIHVLLIESGHRQANDFAARITALTGIDAALVSLAVFPVDGLTLEALFDAQGVRHVEPASTVTSLSRPAMQKAENL